MNKTAKATITVRKKKLIYTHLLGKKVMYIRNTLDKWPFFSIKSIVMGIFFFNLMDEQRWTIPSCMKEVKIMQNTQDIF